MAIESTEFIWFDGEFIPWDEAKVHVISHTLHYGSGVFEGIRAYKTDRGPAIFRLGEHLDRLRYSCEAIRLELPYSTDELTDASTELLRRNKMEQCYIRPLVINGYGAMVLDPEGAPVNTVIACWPWGAYLPHEMVDVKISSYIRIHPDSTVADAKICGHYVNSILATQEIAGSDFHEAILLDVHGRIAEGPGENLFLVKDGVLLTPRLGTILTGITRDTVIQLCRSMGIEVVEQDLEPADAFSADEAFFTGTAAEVTPIRSIDRKVITEGGTGPMTARIRDAYLDVVYGRTKDFEHFLTYV
jgi:branched-chain amino acid aminotransferase